MRTEGEKSDATRLPQASQRHPEVRTAYDVKEIHRALRDFTDDELKQVTILGDGSRLEQGATYVDLADEQRQPIRATGGITVRQGQYWVPKARVPYILWNRLIGEPKPGQV